MGQQLVKNDQSSYNFLKSMVPFFESTASKVGLNQGSILQQCVKMCDSGTFFQFLLGYFKEEEGAVLDNRKPRVDINY